MNDAAPGGLSLMTCHGTLVHHDGRGGLAHLPLADGAASSRLRLDLGALTRAGRHERMLCRTDTPLVLPAVPGLPPGCALVLAADRRTAGLRQAAHYYAAEPQAPAMPCDRPAPGLWESFLLTTEADLAGLHHILGNAWIVATTGRIVGPPDVALRGDFILAVGDVAIDLRYNLPLLPHGPAASHGAAAFAFDVLVEGWRIERLHLYRPLVFFTAFASPFVFDQAVTAIASLLEFGGYTGAIHVITDHDRQAFLDALPSLPPGRLTTQHLAAADWVGYVAAKYAILEHEAAQSCQPLLFLDTDVVCDAPLAPLLSAIVTVERISAALEETSTLQANPSVGATLIQRDGYAPRFAHGLNGGTIGIPNLAQHGETLALIRTIITNHAELHGRDQFRWVDQEVLNYVSYRVGHFDSAAMARFVRFGWENAEHDATRRLGLVHFWPGIPGHPKEDRMRRYVATLRNG